MSRKPRVVLDARPLTQPQAGGYRTYVRALLIGLRERGISDVDLLLYVDREPDAAAQTCLPTGATVRLLSPSRLRSDLYGFAQQVRRDQPDLVHGTVNYTPAVPVKTTVTLHDAILLKPYPDIPAPQSLRQRLLNAYWSKQARRTVRTAYRILTISQYSADEIATTGIPKECLRVVYNGITTPAPTPNLPHLGGVIAFASPDPRKNLTCLYDALPRITAPVRVIAPRNAELPVSGVEILRGLSDQQVADALSQADVFVFPSRIEGFGLPPLEAMRCGCAVVASNASCLPEVLGDAPLYFAPDDPNTCAEAVNRLLSDPQERERRLITGRDHAATFTTRRMAEETVCFWKEAIGG